MRDYISSNEIMLKNKVIHFRMSRALQTKQEHVSILLDCFSESWEERFYLPSSLNKVFHFSFFSHHLVTCHTKCYNNLDMNLNDSYGSARGFCDLSKCVFNCLYLIYFENYDGIKKKSDNTIGIHWWQIWVKCDMVNFYNWAVHKNV